MHYVIYFEETFFQPFTQHKRHEGTYIYVVIFSWRSRGYNLQHSLFLLPTVVFFITVSFPFCFLTFSYDVKHAHDYRSNNRNK